MDDKPMDRRRFFRRGLSELLKPLAGAVQPLVDVGEKLAALERPAPPPPVSRPTARGETAGRAPRPLMVLRPPGARDEATFAKSCTAEGACVSVCPAQCIKIDASGEVGGGKPYIDVDAMPCVLCDGLHCMFACPTGALVPTALADVDMGTAFWRAGTCLRSSGEACTLCVEECPIGEAAITLNAAGDVEVIADGCTGCGVCQHACPTDPKSIVVVPAENLRRARAGMA